MCKRQKEMYPQKMTFAKMTAKITKVTHALFATFLQQLWLSRTGELCINTRGM